MTAVRTNGTSTPKKRASTYESVDAAIQSLLRTTGLLGASHAGTWDYHNADGSLCFHLVRFDLGKGDKAFRPIRPEGDQWVVAFPPGKLPLYNLPKLAGAKHVLVVEGEGCAGALTRVGFVATTSAKGSSAAGCTDWTSLRGLEIDVFPDNDDPGAKYAETVAGILTELDCAVRIVDLEGLPAGGGDVIDFIKAQDSRDDDEIACTIQAACDKAKKWKPPTAPASAEGVGLVLTCMGSIETKTVDWLWPGRVALGAITVISGDPGTGKSTLGIDIIARNSTGAGWPDAPNHSATVGMSLLITGEDSLSRTVKPRLVAARADCDQVHAIENARDDDKDGKTVLRPFSLVTDIPRLDAILAEHPKINLVVIDPIACFLGSTDSHKNSEVRALFTPLADMAERHGVAIVCISHLTKNSATSAIHRTQGSLAFVAAARNVWVVAKDAEDPDRRLFLSVKSNLAKEATGLAYSIVPFPDNPAVGMLAWEAAPVTVTVDEAMSADRRPQREDRDLACEWLREALKDGAVESSVIYEEGKENGITQRTLRRAAKDLGIVPSKTGFQGKWTWALPDMATSKAPDA